MRGVWSAQRTPRWCGRPRHRSGGASQACASDDRPLRERRVPVTTSGDVAPVSSQVPPWDHELMGDDTQDQGSVRLAVVDDHRAISKGVPEGLAPFLDLVVPVVRVLTVDELLAEASEFDVVVLDVWLADHSEPQENVGRLRERGWNVVMYTGELRPAVLGRCLQAGANGLVGKHEEWAVLAEAVQVAATGGVFMNVDWASAVEAMTLDSVPELSPREREVIELYAAGLPLKSVARRLAIAEETAREHLKRVRRKYQAVGRSADTKTDLYRRAVEDGHLPAPDGSCD